MTARCVAISHLVVKKAEDLTLFSELVKSLVPVLDCFVFIVVSFPSYPTLCQVICELLVAVWG